MQYDCIDCLPDSVKAALDEKGQKMWMDAFNSTVKKSGNKKTYREAVFNAWQMIKSYPGCRFFSGFVSTEDLDKQNDVVAVEKAYERIINHVNRGGTMVDTHTNRTVGAFIFAERAINKTGKQGVKAYSVVYQGEPYYETVWNQIKKGIDCPTCPDVRKGYSIGGFALDTVNTCDMNGCHREILDMSIHEISVCQDPANPEAVIQEVNMMAKSESENTTNENEINKALNPTPAAKPEMPVAPGAAPAGPAQAQPSVDAAMQAAGGGGQAGPSPDAQNKEAMMASLTPETVMAWTKQEHKKMEQWRKYLEMMRGLTDPAVTTGVAKSDLPDVEKATPNCGCINEDYHTSITGTCPEEKEVNGDVHDPQVGDGKIEFLENKDIEADESAKKTKGGEKKNLMPGKDEALFKEFKDGEKAEVSKEGKNSAVTEKTDALKGTDDVDIKGKDLKDIGEEPEHKKTEKEDKKDYDSKPENKPNSVTDKGDPREKNFGKEGKEVFMKCGGEEIPEELMPAFKQFLAEKGITLKPEIESNEIAGPMEKTLYVDSDISELDLLQLSDPIQFDSSAAMGKSATQRLKVQQMMTKMRLAKNLRVADISFLVPEELEKAGEGPMPEIPPDVPKQSDYLKPRQKVKLMRHQNENPMNMRPKSNEEIADMQGISRSGKAEDIVEAVLADCPHCKRHSLHKFGNFEGCAHCGYHNVPHEGTPKKKLSKAGEAASGANPYMAVAQEAGKMATAPVNAVAGVLRHAGQIGANQQQPKTATQNLASGAGNLGLGAMQAGSVAQQALKNRTANKEAQAAKVEKPKIAQEQPPQPPQPPAAPGNQQSYGVGPQAQIMPYMTAQAMNPMGNVKKAWEKYISRKR